MTEQTKNGGDVEAVIESGAGADQARRRILKVGAALAAGAFATTVMNRDDARAAGPLNGQSNNGVAAVTGYNSVNGPGVWGKSVQGVGVWGVAEYNDGDGVVGYAGETGRGVSGHSVDGIGVEAYSETNRAIVATADDDIAISAESPNWTAIRGSSNIDNGVHGISNDSVGVKGESLNHVGVQGDSDNGKGVLGTSWHSDGVTGESVDAIGVHGTSQNGIGVVGDSATQAGVRGYSEQQRGVEGVSPYGTGVYGYSVEQIGTVGHSYEGVGLVGRVEEASGTALQAEGRARFETAGNATCPVNTLSFFVAEPLTTIHSHVSVTFMADPSPSSKNIAMIKWVERIPDVGFRVHLTNTVQRDTPVSYLVVDPIVYHVTVDPNDTGPND